VADTLGVLGSKLKFASVTVKWQAEATLPPILGSAISIEQVLINLIANACDAYVARQATAPCKRSIDIHARQEQGMVVIEVQDQAGGIPEAVLPRVFEPFFTTKPVGQGTGLGLSISYGIVTDMGGSITVGNRDGGAWFQLRLPATGTEAAAPEQP
jgi:two-component system C4-dicarboxylate transport sensor histidine kinase DctB